MREILFRGKDRFTNEWVYGLPFMGLDGEIDGIETEPTCKGCRYIVPETLSQFTGKFDKSGNKIFEGDVVYAMMYYDPAGGLYPSLVTINWHDEYGSYQWEYFEMSTVKVVGNKWDNPEMLKGGYDMSDILKGDVE